MILTTVEFLYCILLICILTLKNIRHDVLPGILVPVKVAWDFGGCTATGVCNSILSPKICIGIALFKSYAYSGNFWWYIRRDLKKSML
jgi:hypothetical protein